MSKFIVISSNIDATKHNETLNSFEYLHMMNCFVIFEDEKEIKVKISNIFTPDEILTLHENQENLTELLFPNEFKNLSNYNLTILTLIQPPLASYDENGKLVCQYCPFLDIIQERFKMNFTIHVLARGDRKSNAYATLALYIVEIFTFRNYNNLYVNINRHYRFPGNIPKLRTFDPSDRCFMVTRPPKIPIYEQILIKPFDNSIWMLLAITTGCCALVWRIYKNFGAVDSHWNFLFVSFGYFLGQSINLKM